MTRMILLGMVISLALLASACYSYQPIMIGKEGSWWNESIVRGDYVRLFLKNGQKVEAMRVLQIDSTRIEGMRIYLQPDGTRYERCEVVLVMNVETVKLRKESWFAPRDFNGAGFFFLGMP